MEKLLNPSTIISGLLGLVLSILVYVYNKDLERFEKSNKAQWEAIKELRADVKSINIDPDKVNEAILKIDRNEERSLQNEVEVDDLFNKYDKARDDAFEYLRDRHNGGNDLPYRN